MSWAKRTSAAAVQKDPSAARIPSGARRRHHGRKVEDRERGEHERREREPGAHGRVRVQVGEVPLEHERADREPDGGGEDQPRAQQCLVVPAQVDAQEYDDTDEAP
jgi:hypothetical protein